MVEDLGLVAAREVFWPIVRLAAAAAAGWFFYRLADDYSQKDSETGCLVLVVGIVVVCLILGVRF